jgi:hypothetical protein
MEPPTQLPTLPPSLHPYLGSSLIENQQQRQFLVPGSTYENLVLIPLHDVVLFPGSTLPLRLRSQALTRQIKQGLLSSETNHIGVINMVANNEMSNVGSTIEVRMSNNNNEEQDEEMILTRCCLSPYLLTLLAFPLLASLLTSPLLNSRYFLLRCIALHCIALHCIASHFIALHCIALHCIASHCIALHRISLHCIALHCITLHYIALHRIALHCIL